MPTLYTSLIAKHRSFSPARRNPERLKYVAEAAKKPLSTVSPLHSALQQIAMARLATPGAAQTAAPLRERKTVAIMGAGLAGLCAAYELQRAGFEVEVFEARDRVGGRTKTVTGVVRDKSGKPGKFMDGGAELIGDNHPLWLYYADHFGLELSDARDYDNSPTILDGRILSDQEGAKLTKDLDKLIKKLTQEAERIVDAYEPWMNPDAHLLDSLSLLDWLNHTRGKKQARHALQKLLEADGGVPADKQSLLAVLAMVRGGGLDRFWTDSELHRCNGGTQSLANKFKSHLSTVGVKIHLRTQVCAIDVNDAGVTLLHHKVKKANGAEDPAPLTTVPKGATPFHADFAILAIPPSVWTTLMKVAPSQLATLLSTKIPQMGINVKNLMAFDRRFWRDTALGPALSTDGLVDMTWETTEDDPEVDPQFGLVAFSGAGEAKKLSKMSHKQRVQHYKQNLELAYKGYAGAVRKQIFENWPVADWTKASYCFPAPGEVTTWGPIYKAGFQNRLFFAGEHTSYAYMGYMEGALSSGFRVAARIAVRDKIGM